MRQFKKITIKNMILKKLKYLIIAIKMEKEIKIRKIRKEIKR